MITIGKSPSKKYWQVKYKDAVLCTCTTRREAIDKQKEWALSLVSLTKLDK
jgi:hypothetical protein